MGKEKGGEDGTGINPEMQSAMPPFLTAARRFTLSSFTAIVCISRPCLWHKSVRLKDCACHNIGALYTVLTCQPYRLVREDGAVLFVCSSVRWR